MFPYGKSITYYIYRSTVTQAILQINLFANKGLITFSALFCINILPFYNDFVVEKNIQNYMTKENVFTKALKLFIKI